MLLAFYQNSDIFNYMEHILVKLSDLNTYNYGYIVQILAVNAIHPVRDIYIDNHKNVYNVNIKQ